MWSVSLGALVLGAYADRVGRKADRVRIMLAFGVAILALMYPCFAPLIAYPGSGVILAVTFVVGVLKSGYFAPLPAMMAELFPITNRATGMALSYNIDVVTFGGTTPLVIVWLVDATGDKLEVTYYLMVLAVLSLVCVGRARRLGVH